MPKRDIAVWLVVAISILFLAFFPFLNPVLGGPVQPWHPILVLNIVAPVTLWLLIKGVEVKASGSRKHLPVPHVKLVNSLPVPGLDLKIPIWIFSLVLGLIVAIPGILGFGRFYGMAAQMSDAFFQGMINTYFLIWGIAVFVIAYTYLKSRVPENKAYVSFSVQSPLLGVAVGMLGSVHVLFMILLNYRITQYATPDVFAYWFYEVHRLTGLNRITAASVELIFGFFLIEMLVLLSVYSSRKKYGLNKAREYRQVALNLAIGMVFFSVLFILIPYLFFPISSVFGMLL